MSSILHTKKFLDPRSLHAHAHTQKHKVIKKSLRTILPLNWRSGLIFSTIFVCFSFFFFYTGHIPVTWWDCSLTCYQQSGKHISPRLLQSASSCELSAPTNVQNRKPVLHFESSQPSVSAECVAASCSWNPPSVCQLSFWVLVASLWRGDFLAHFSD